MTNEELLKVIEEAKASEVTNLDLRNKNLTALPSEICYLSNLTYLNLGGNKLTSLPSKLHQLTNITELYLWGNQLEIVPNEIFKLTNMVALGLNKLLLTHLPSKISQLSKLEWLDLSDNQLATLPPEICQLSKLKKLDLRGTQLTSPPYEIATQGIKAIRRYFADLEKGTQPLNEVKVLLIGDGAAGKTSLVKQLFGQPFDKHEDTTHGISIRGWEQKVVGRKIKINIWDFGGQEIQHATHQFFLSKRSLYVLVLDGRKDERTEYWLRHVEAFGGDSPVLIVLNKIDSNPSFDLNRPFLLEKYLGIRDFFRISCKTGKNIAEFKEALLAELARVEMLETIWPASWFAVKRRLEEMDKPYISADQYGSICKEAGITEEESRETLVDFLHDLGVAVHFRDFILDAMSVLNPVWVTNAVYTIITSEEMADSKGFLALKDLGELLPQGCGEKLCCPQETHAFILELMQKFELCYELSRGSVLIPQLLPVPEPELDFNKDGSLRFALHYPDFLPPSVFPRFMVKVHKDIHANTCWRTGVLLADQKSGAQALVKVDMEARRINLWVQGERPREYLHYLRYLLADINSSFEKLTVSERVPMPDEPQRTADYETLRKCAERGIERYMPDGSDKDYSVHELLGLVQPKDADEVVRVAEKDTQQSNESWAEVLNELFEPKWTVPVLGITFNMQWLFRKVLEKQKQKRRQGR